MIRAVKPQSWASWAVFCSDETPFFWPVSMHTTPSKNTVVSKVPFVSKEWWYVSKQAVLLWCLTEMNCNWHNGSHFCYSASQRLACFPASWIQVEWVGDCDRRSEISHVSTKWLKMVWCHQQTRFCLKGLKLLVNFGWRTVGQSVSCLSALFEGALVFFLQKDFSCSEECPGGAEDICTVMYVSKCYAFKRHIYIHIYYMTLQCIHL